MKPKCSIVIRAYNEEAHLGRLLDGIQHQTIKNRQVIVVDSGSTDLTPEIARGYGADLVHINPKEFSFGRSLNSGIRAAKSDFVVIASAHVYPVYPDWLEKILSPFSDRQVALTYGKQRGSEQSHFSENQLFQHWYPQQAEPIQSHPFCNNANAAIRRSYWERQPYNENLPALEDLAWAKWAFEKGYRVVYVPEAEIIHVHHETSIGIFNRYKREGMAFKQIYPHENFRVGELFRLFFTNVVSDWQAAAAQKQFSRQMVKIVEFRWNQFLGTYRGYQQSGPLTWKLKRSFYYPLEQAEKTNQATTRDVEPIAYEKIKTERSKGKE
jgi:rhamnosyltransferase